jgi:TRAP-type C4-dicarboxylate transport system permease small subunit
MKRVFLLATMVALVAMLALAPMALAQGTTMMGTGSPAPKVPPSGGPAILLPAAALLLGSGILTYAILRRR